MPPEPGPSTSDTPQATASPAVTQDTPSASPAPAAASPAASQEPRSRGFGAFINSLFRGSGTVDAQDDEPTVSEDGPQELPKDTQDTTATPSAATDGKATAEKPTPTAAELAAQLEALSDDELAKLPTTSEKLRRLVQSETDKREHKRQREERDRQRAELEAKEREARETDPYEAAELRNQLDAQREADEAAAREEAEREAAAKEQQERLGSLISGTIRTYDQATLDPLLAAVPAQERERILGAITGGIDGRKQAVVEAIKVLQDAARKEGEAAAQKKLRNSDPFRKQVLRDEREEEDEPELVTSGAPRSAQPPDMNDLFRQAASSLRGGSRGNPLRRMDGD